ncbi:MAG: ABC-2 family transporter protein [Gemmataceae bacterium]|nr:ABC-2 family transporter protein [Gemmataceae bacterium]
MEGGKDAGIRRGLGSYFRLLGAFGRFSLNREMAFRGNFLMKVLLEVVWLGILLLFFHTIFRNTSRIEGWNEYQYLFFLGCYYALEGLIETLFLENCVEFGELVRTGNLDFFLLKPIDEQFLLSFRHIDWSTAPKILIGAALMGFGLWELGEPVTLARLGGFLVALASGIAMAYSFLLMLASTAIWMVRNQSLMELWWLFSSLMRYPRDIYEEPWAVLIQKVFTFLLPALLVVSVPAEAMVRILEPAILGWTVCAGFMMLLASRWVFRKAIRSYRSASS